MSADYDTSLDSLLALDGVTYFVDDAGTFAVKFIVKQVVADSKRPHGLRYSLTLHGENGERLVGFDNAHPVRVQQGPAGKRNRKFDHRHRLKTIQPYEYKNASELVADFWEQVDKMLKEKGVLP